MAAELKRKDTWSAGCVTLAGRLRTGLPVVCERPVLNCWLIEQIGLGALVDYQNDRALVDAALSIASDPPHNHSVEQSMVENHSCDARAALYEPIIELVAAKAGRIRKVGVSAVGNRLLRLGLDEALARKPAAGAAVTVNSVCLCAP